VRLYVEANNAILAGNDSVLDPTITENEFQLKKQVEENKLFLMAKVEDFLEMWQGGQNLPATQKESRSQSKEITAVGYILENEVIVRASWSNMQHDSIAAITLSERSPLPPAWSEKHFPGGRTELFNVCCNGMAAHDVSRAG